MPVCPVDLVCCELPDCTGGICERSGEYALIPCTDCGTMVCLRGMCFDCIDTTDVEKKDV